jgi:uncharacterized protein YxjI
LRKHISAVLVFALVLTLLLTGIPGVAKAAGSAELTVKPKVSELLKGGDVTFEYSIHNSGAAEIPDYSIVYAGKAVESGAKILVDDTANGEFTMKVDDSMLGQTLTFTLQSSDGTSATATAKVNKKAASVKLGVTVKTNKEIADAGDTVTFTFTLENQGEADITDIVVKAPNLNSGKALKDKFSLAAGSDPYTFSYKYTMTTGDIVVTPKISYKANGTDQTPITKDPITVTLSKRDVNVSATVDNKNPQAGEEVNFTLTITNNGNMSYSGMKVTMNGEAVDFPSSTLKPDDSFDKTYTSSFETSTEVTFSVTMKDKNGEQVNVTYGPIQIQLPVDSSQVSDKLKLIMNVDRPQLTSAGAVNFTGYISNATDYDFINLQVNEASLGNVYSASALEASGQANIEWTADVNATTTYNFVLTATDQDGNNYTINAEPITVAVQSVTPTPTNFEDAANVTESGQLLDNGKSSFDWSKFFLILAIVLVVLIIGVGAALIVLWKKGKMPGGGRPSSGRPTSSGRPAPRPASSSSVPRKKPSNSSSYGRGPSPRRPSGTKSYRDRNNF